MTLSGNLGFVSLDEVLRLLTRSNQHGRVEVKGEGISGRVYLGQDGIDLASTTDDASLQALLVTAGMADNQLPSAAGETIVPLLREITVESIYQLSRSGGDFEVFQGDTTPYASPRAFELESALAEVRQRAADWQEVSKRVPDLTAPVMFVRDLEGREEVKVSQDAWKVLSEIGRGRSVREMAASLGTTDFWTARVTAQLLDDGLVSTTSPGETYSAPVPVAAQPAVQPEPEGEPPVEPEAEPEGEPARPATEIEDKGGFDPNQSWWSEPEREAAEEPEEPIFQESAELESFTDEQEDSGDETETDLEEDTEAFLEKVFSELEPKDPPAEEEKEEGYGLLRRRRLGSMRDLSND